MADQDSSDLNTRMRMSTHASDTSTLRTMISFTLMMVTFPIMSYFISKYVMETIFNMESATFYAAGVAVLNVHAILALFVYVAWNEDTSNKQGKSD